MVTTVGQWTGRLACALQASAGMTNEGFADWLGIAVRTVAYWHSRPDTVPGNANQELLHTALKRLPAGAQSRFLAGIGDPSSKPGGVNGADVVSDAADAISNDSLLARIGIPHDSIESMQQDMALLARSGSIAAFDMFANARRLRDEARALADRTRRPRDLTHLYVLIAQGTSLMASTAFDLGRWVESTTLARAATQYADLAGHPSLKAWTYGLRMTLANWRNEPDAALGYFERAMRVAPEGEPKMRLRHIAARSHALLNDAGTVTDILAAARRDREVAENRPDELAATTGGEFAFGDARAAACAAAAWLDLGNGERAAARADEALRLFQALPAARRSYSQISGANIDIAAAYLHLNDIDAATDALSTVLDLPPHKRNVSLTGRLARITRLLSQAPWNGDAQARQLAERIAAWLPETSTRRLA
ncbi:hypothetical protein [Micromonospora sp. WMMD737]|uniref:hypothetical protein n=1 Tax=Micromonospora sp. WMMD737 TaxID=3404113 RepID=UPI003B929235